jgi:hypothetical protein
MAQEEKLIALLSSMNRELGGIRRALMALWHREYKDRKASNLSPELFTDEFITIAECARRLSIKKITIDHLIAKGLNGGVEGWKEGYHYVVIPPLSPKDKPEVRIPWNTLLSEWLPYNELTPQQVYRFSNVDRQKEPDRYDESTYKTNEE